MKMKKAIKNIFLIACLVMAALLLFEGCASSKYPYRKKRNSRKCNDCPKWSQANPAPLVQMKADGTI